MGNTGKLDPIRFHLKQNNLTMADLARVVGCIHTTIHNYCNDPGRIPLKHLVIIAGMFGMKPEELVYILLRYQPNVRTQHNKHGLFYLENIREKYK